VGKDDFRKNRKKKGEITQHLVEYFKKEVGGKKSKKALFLEKKMKWNNRFKNFMKGPSDL